MIYTPRFGSAEGLLVEAWCRQREKPPRGWNISFYEVGAQTCTTAHGQPNGARHLFD